MDEQPHYRFPPASAYRLNRCLFALKSDDAFRARFLQDARAAMSELELDAEDAAALLRGPRRAPGPRGAPVSRVHGGPAPADGARTRLLRVFLKDGGSERRSPRSL